MIEELKGLRGGKHSENSSVGVIGNVKKFMLKLSNSMGTIQNHYKVGDMEEAGKALKALTGDVNSVNKSVKDVQRLQGTEKNLAQLFAEGDEISVHDGIISLKDIPNSMLGEQIHQEAFDRIVQLSKELTETLEDVDLSLLEEASTKKKTHLNSSPRHIKSQPVPKNKQQAAFESENSHFDTMSFFKMNSEFNSGNTGGFNNFKTSSLKSIQKQMKVQRRGISLPKLSTFVSVRDYETVLEKHRLRQEKMDVCLPECDISNSTCNCGMLFDCVKKMDEYDMAA